MAFATKYKTSIKSWTGDTITAEIQEDGFAGTLEEFTAVGGNAIEVEHQCNVNIKESYIIPSAATVRMYVNDEWDMNDLLYASDNQFQVLITNGSTDVFVGWVISGINTEDYTTGQYIIQIRAIDGLTDLKNEPYLNSGALYDAFRFPLTIIQDCLAKTGFSLRLRENCDIYAAAGMTTTTNTHSPLNQSYIYTSAYGDRIDNVLSCWDVLEKLCQAFHSRIFLHRRVGTDEKRCWHFSKIDKIGSTETYREFNSNGSYNTFQSYAPLLTMGTGIKHVNGKGQLSVKQAYKEVILKAERGEDYNTLTGENFEENDFASSSSLNDWGTLTTCKLVATWGTATIAQETYLGNEVASLEPYTNSHPFNFGDAKDNGSGKVRLHTTNVHALVANDWVLIMEGIYRRMWKVITKIDNNNVDLDANYVSDDDEVSWVEVTAAEGIEANFALPLGNDISPAGDDDQNVKLEFSFNIQSTRNLNVNAFPVTVIVMQNRIATNYETLNNDGDFVPYNANYIDAVIVPLKSRSTVISNELNTFEVTGSISFIVSTAKFYVALMALNGDSATYVDRVSYNYVKVSFLGGSEKETTTAIDSDVIDSLDVDFFHSDGDGGSNDEYRFNNPIYDDATPKRFINSWQQDGATADNLEDIILSNLATSYGANSQIWSGTIQGDINISNSIKDPLNFDRVFQIQKIVRNYETNYCNISMIEIEPSESYIVEQIGDDGIGGTYYFLSTTYGDISADFTSADTFEISPIRARSGGAILDSGGARTADGNSSFVSSRVRILVSDGEYTGADTETKGILRKL